MSKYKPAFRYTASKERDATREVSTSVWTNAWSIKQWNNQRLIHNARAITDRRSFHKTMWRTGQTLHSDKSYTDGDNTVFNQQTQLESSFYSECRRDLVFWENKGAGFSRPFLKCLNRWDMLTDSGLQYCECKYWKERYCRIQEITLILSNQSPSR